MNTLQANTTLVNLVGNRIYFQTNKSGQYPAITFFVYNELGELFADNREIKTGYYIQVDIWSKDNYNTIVNEVMKSMTQAGYRRTSSIDLYEDDTQIYHKAIRFAKEF
jgi:hypothetical protein